MSVIWVGNESDMSVKYECEMSYKCEISRKLV